MILWGEILLRDLDGVRESHASTMQDHIPVSYPKERVAQFDIWHCQFLFFIILLPPLLSPGIYVGVHNFYRFSCLFRLDFCVVTTGCVFKNQLMWETNKWIMIVLCFLLYAPTQHLRLFAPQKSCWGGNGLMPSRGGTKYRAGILGLLITDFFIQSGFSGFFSTTSSGNKLSRRLFQSSRLCGPNRLWKKLDFFIRWGKNCLQSPRIWPMNAWWTADGDVTRKQLYRNDGICIKWLAFATYSRPGVCMGNPRLFF